MQEIIQLKLIQIDTNGYHLLIPCKLIDNTEKYLILDTGASNSVLDRVALNDYITPARTGDFYIEEYYRKNMDNSRGISNHELHFTFGRMELVQLGNLELKNILFPLLDLQHLQEIYASVGYENVIGILGCDFLLKTNAVIDFKKRTLEINYNSEDLSLF